jgi:subtilisin family serine protease
LTPILVRMPHRRTPILGAACGVALALPLFLAPRPALAAPDADAKPPAQWPLTYLKADQVWQLTKGADVTVGLVDSGVSPLGDTRPNLLPGADFSSGPTSIGPAHLDTDTDSHGTTMAVLIAGAGGGLGLKGLAPEAKILPVRMQKQTGEDPDKITDALKWATFQHVKVINMSLGTSPTPALAAAVKAAQDADIVVVAAAGNAGTNHVITPASYPGVLAVGAVDDGGARWDYSSFGPQLALTAPGVGILVEDAAGTLKTVRGTSNSTAYVTASAALVRSLHPDWTAGQTIRALLATATKAGGATGLGRNDNYGYGIVNPLAALGIGAPAARDDPLMPGAAPLAAATAASAAPPSSAPPSTSPSAPATTTPSAPSASGGSAAAVGPAAATTATKPTGLLSTKRNKLLAVAGGGLLVAVFVFGLNSSLKRRSERKNRAWH